MLQYLLITTLFGFYKFVPGCRKFSNCQARICIFGMNQIHLPVGLSAENCNICFLVCLFALSSPPSNDIGVGLTWHREISNRRRRVILYNQDGRGRYNAALDRGTIESVVKKQIVLSIQCFTINFGREEGKKGKRSEVERCVQIGKLDRTKRESASTSTNFQSFLDFSNLISFFAVSSVASFNTSAGLDSIDDCD